MKRRESLGMDLTPIIDVIFILLIFFMVSSVFKKEDFALKLDLPSAQAKALEVKQDEVLIEINTLFYAIKGIKVPFASLKNHLADIKNKNKTIIVRIDKKVSYERVIKVLDILQQYDLNNLALITKEE